MVNSRKKGARSERGAAEVLENWTGFEMVRVPRSGGLRWASGLMVTGDIIPSDPLELATFPFSVEVKGYNTLDFRNMLTAKSSDFLKFWKQATQDALRVGKIPLLMVRLNGMPKESYYVAIPRQAFIRINALVTGGEDIPYFLYSGVFVIFMSDHLFTTDFKKIKARLKKYKFTDEPSIDSICY